MPNWLVSDVKGNKVTITVDISKRFDKSKSGKSTIVASSEGNKTVAIIKGKEVKIGGFAFVVD